MGTAAHAPVPINAGAGTAKRSQCEESRFRPHQANAKPAAPTSSTPAMMGTSPGLPNSPEPSFRDTAAACVAFADFVTGVSQFDVADGLADAAEGDAALLVASGVGVSSTAETEGSGATVSAGAGTGSAGTGGVVGTGAGDSGDGAGVGVADGGSVGFPVPGPVGGAF
jgi:hypothetical protein